MLVAPRGIKQYLVITQGFILFFCVIIIPIFLNFSKHLTLLKLSGVPDVEH